MSPTTQPPHLTMSLVMAVTQRVLQLTAVCLLCLLAIALTGATILAAFGTLPWPDIAMTYGETTYQIGAGVQIGLTLLAVALCAYVPANGRIMALETSHRRFRISMQDVMQAYQAAHAADRAGHFSMSEQYDAVRERMLYLRDHPELGGLEPDILESAAQMSTISHDLAETYSDEAVARAKGFLRQRQEECASFEKRIEDAKHKTHEIRQWAHEVEMDESVARAQVDRLRDELSDILPELAAETPMDPRLNASPANRMPAE
ncbi:DNA repair protein [Pseudooceanicola sp. HF7]|uniref:DNA repair protein n=1 Tax=Pseudooceanicola sp. HF7 TaxID=2721560 RepID=UPI00143215F6|nr:DNA repair protein [Pseudooceanicola sp. HF7]NIZ09243.1 DNA repair protein [Pseudooceanicola sp. HF7]